MSKVNTERIQAVLNWKYFREVDALKVRQVLQSENPSRWDDRTLITEAIIALGEKLEPGWLPPQRPTSVTINADVMVMLDEIKQSIQTMQSLATMFANMDLTQLRQMPGWDENTYQSLQSEGLKRGAAKLLADDTVFDEDDDF